MKPERYGRHWRLIMPDGRSLFDRETGYPRIWPTKRATEAFIAANPDAQQPEFPEARGPINFGAVPEETGVHLAPDGRASVWL